MDTGTAMDIIFYGLVAVTVAISVLGAMALVVMAIEVADEYRQDRKA